MAKRIVICADGTWNKPEQTDQGTPCSTNVVKIVTAVRPQDSKGMTQVVYYHKGVGERGGLWDCLTGGAFGVGISQNIEDIYLFLISNYAPGDELFLLGFSRGAYTARSVAGFIRNSGILKPEFLSKYKEAYDLYRDRSDASHPRSEQAVNFRNLLGAGLGSLRGKRSWAGLPAETVRRRAHTAVHDDLNRCIAFAISSRRCATGNDRGPH